MANIDQPTTTTKLDTGEKPPPGKPTIDFHAAVEPPKDTSTLGYFKGAALAVVNLGVGLYDSANTRSTVADFNATRAALKDPLGAIGQMKDNVIAAWQTGDHVTQGQLIGTGLILGLGGTLGARSMLARSEGALVEATTTTIQAKVTGIGDMLASAQPAGTVPTNFGIRIGDLAGARRPVVLEPAPLESVGVPVAGENEAPATNLLSLVDHDAHAAVAGEALTGEALAGMPTVNIDGAGLGAQRVGLPPNPVANTGTLVIVDGDLDAGAAAGVKSPNPQPATLAPGQAIRRPVDSGLVDPPVHGHPDHIAYGEPAPVSGLPGSGVARTPQFELARDLEGLNRSLAGTNDGAAAGTFAEHTRTFQQALDRVTSNQDRTLEDVQSLQQSFVTVTDSARAAGASPQAISGLQDRFMQSTVALNDGIALREALSSRETLTDLGAAIDGATISGATVQTVGMRTIQQQFPKLASTIEEYLQPYTRAPAGDAALQRSATTYQTVRDQFNSLYAIVAKLSPEEAPLALRTSLRELDQRITTIATAEARTDFSAAQQSLRNQVIKAGLGEDPQFIKFDRRALELSNASTLQDMTTAGSDLLAISNGLAEKLAPGRPVAADLMKLRVQRVMQTAQTAGLRNAERTTISQDLDTDLAARTRTRTQQIPQRTVLGTADDSKITAIPRTEQPLPSPLPKQEALPLRGALDKVSAYNIDNPDLQTNARAFGAQVERLQTLPDATAQDLRAFRQSYDRLTDAAHAASVPQSQMAELDAAYRAARRRIADNIADAAAQRDLAAGRSLTPSARPTTATPAGALSPVQRALVDDGWTAEANTARNSLERAQRRITEAIRTDGTADQDFKGSAAARAETEFQQLQDAFTQYERNPSPHTYAGVRDRMLQLERSIAGAVNDDGITPSVWNILDDATTQFRTSFTAMAADEADIEAAFARQAARNQIEAVGARTAEALPTDAATAIQTQTPAAGSLVPQAVQALTTASDEAAGALWAARSDEQATLAARSQLINNGVEIAGKLNADMTPEELQVVRNAITGIADTQAEVIAREAELADGQVRPRPQPVEEPLAQVGAQTGTATTPVAATTNADALALEKLSSIEAQMRTAASPADFRLAAREFRASADAYEQALREQAAVESAEAGAVQPSAGQTAAVPVQLQLVARTPIDVEARVASAADEYALARVAQAAACKAQLPAELLPAADAVLYAANGNNYRAALNSFSTQLEDFVQSQLNSGTPVAPDVVRNARAFIADAQDAVQGRRMAAISHGRFPSLQESLFYNPNMATWLGRRLPAAVATLGGAAFVVGSQPILFKSVPSDRTSGTTDPAKARTDAAPVQTEAVPIRTAATVQPLVPAVAAPASAMPARAEATLPTTGVPHPVFASRSDAGRLTNTAFVRSATLAAPPVITDTPIVSDQVVFTRTQSTVNDALSLNLFTPPRGSSTFFERYNNVNFGGIILTYLYQPAGVGEPSAAAAPVMPSPASPLYSSALTGSSQLTRVTNTAFNVPPLAARLNLAVLGNPFAQHGYTSSIGTTLGGQAGPGNGPQQLTAFLRQQVESFRKVEKDTGKGGTAGKAPTYVNQTVTGVASTDPQAPATTMAATGTTNPDDKDLSLTTV